jgi:hypothetical protein
MAEDPAESYSEVGVRRRHVYSEVTAFDRIKVPRDPRRGELDVPAGIHLLGEALDRIRHQRRKPAPCARTDHAGQRWRVRQARPPVNRYRWRPRDFNVRKLPIGDLQL